MSSDIFDTILSNIQRMDSSFQPGKIIPQKRKTSIKLNVFEKTAINLLVPGSWPPVYTKAGHLAKRQPKSLQIGDIAYVSLRENGLLNLYPFAMAGSGYEFVIDAEEGIHFEFIKEV